MIDLTPKNGDFAKLVENLHASKQLAQSVANVQANQLDQDNEQRAAKHMQEQETAQVIATGLPPVQGWAGLQRGWAKLTGQLPLGVDAPTPLLRKTIGGGAALLECIRFGFLALLMVVGAVLLLFASLGSSQPNMLMTLIGLALLPLAYWFFQTAQQKWQLLHAVVKAQPRSEHSR